MYTEPTSPNTTAISGNTISENGAPTVTTEEKYHQVYQVASNLYKQQPDWVAFFREVLGIEGVARQAFPEPEDMAEFERSPQFDGIQQMLAKLREKSKSSGNQEPTRVITVRMPKSLHESLRVEAHEHHTSMNKLCISKLLQIVNDQLVPGDS